MKKKTKIFIAAGSLVLLGCILFVCIMSALKWDFTKLSTATYENNLTEINQPFHNISISTETANVVFALSEDEICRVECYEDAKAKHTVTVENDTLAVKINNQKAWYDYIGFRFGSQKITVYLPKTAYDVLTIEGKTGNVEISKDYSFARADISCSTGNVDFGASVSESARIQTSTGNIRVEHTSIGALALSVTTGGIHMAGVTCTGSITVGVSTGKAYLTDVVCENFMSSGSTGNITLNNVIAEKTFSIERSTGDVNFTRCDAAQIYIKTSTGDVRGSLLSDKVFITHTDTGRVRVPQTISGGRCEIDTATGNIEIEID